MKTHFHPRLVTSIGLLALLLGLAACGEQQAVEPLRAARAQPSATQTAPADTPAQQAGAASGSLEIHSFEMGFKPAKLDVEKPGRYSISSRMMARSCTTLPFPTAPSSSPTPRRPTSLRSRSRPAA